jgi:hypothetical protein
MGSLWAVYGPYRLLTATDAQCAIGAHGNMPGMDALPLHLACGGNMSLMKYSRKCLMWGGMSVIDGASLPSW